MQNYGKNNLLSPRANKGSANVWMYFCFLAGSKLSRVFGLYLTYDILKVIHLVQFLCIIKAISSVFFIFLQKPFSSGRKISKNQWFRITRHAMIGVFLQLLWLFGLTLCGPLRTVLLYEHSDVVLVAAAGALCMSPGATPAKLRGAVMMLAGVVSLLLFDHDDVTVVSPYEPETHKHSSVITHTFYHVVNSLGWSDHKGGVVLLFFTLILQCGYNNVSKKLSLDVGGGKRLHALSTLFSFLILVPWATFITFTTDSDLESPFSLVFPFLIISAFVFVIDFYIDAIATNHLTPLTSAKASTAISFIGALVLATCWNHPLISSITTMNKLKEVVREDHILSTGVMFTLLVFIVATFILCNPGRASRGSFIGYSPGGMPLYSYTSDALQRTTNSVSSFIKNTASHVMDDANSRRIAYFLLINLCFTFVELLYGVLTNSLGLISDGFHMLFDCSALVMGLCAAVMSRWKPSRSYSFGYDRIEVLSGFINGLFLVVIAFFVFAAALSRIIHPQEVKTEKLLTVSVMGLCVNLVGIFAFHGSHGHSHGLSHGHSHTGQSPTGHSHSGHAHSGHAHTGHSHTGHSHSPQSSHSHSRSSTSKCEGHKAHNTNMEGVFLHILADTLGSVGVIISSILIEHFGWTMADPICSIFIAILIFISVVPLLKETSTFLLLATPVSMVDSLRLAIERALTTEGVIGYRDPHFWYHTSTRSFGTIHIQAAGNVQEQKLSSQITSIFKESGLDDISVQMEKQSYFNHLHGLSNKYQEITQYSHNSSLLLPKATIKSV